MNLLSILIGQSKVRVYDWVVEGKGGIGGSKGGAGRGRKREKEEERRKPLWTTWMGESTNLSDWEVSILPMKTYDL